MTKSDIENKLKPFTDSITDGTLSTMSAIRLHLALLLDIRKIGVPVPIILEISGCPYSPSTFSDKLSKLRKETQNNTSNDSSILNQNYAIKTSTQQSIESVQEFASNTNKDEQQSNIEPPSISEIEIKAWKKAFAFSRPSHPNVFPLIIPTLTKAGWTPENYHILKKQFDINTFSQLNMVLSNIMSCKFRKIIFRDGKAVF